MMKHNRFLITLISVVLLLYAPLCMAEDTSQSLSSYPKLKQSADVSFELEGYEYSDVYKESYFPDSSYKYDHDLARFSLFMAIAGATADKSGWGKTDSDGSTEESSRRAANIVKVLKEIGFSDENILLYNYGITLNNHSDKVAYTIASGSLSNGKNLVAVIIRGSGYGAEWSSNFHVGVSAGNHTAYNTAAEEVFQTVTDRLGSSATPSRIWIMGQSRGAAVANLLAAKLDNYSRSNEYLSAEDIYTYTFSTPQGAFSSNKPDDSLYNNIFNIVNPGDAVPQLAPSGWGFSRYGVTKLLNTEADSQTYAAVNDIYKSLTGNSVDSEKIVNQEEDILSTAEIIEDHYSTRQDAQYILLLFQDFLRYMNTKKMQDGRWEELSGDDMETFFLDLYGDKYAEGLSESIDFIDYYITEDVITELAGSDEAVDTICRVFALAYVHNITLDELFGLLGDLVAIPTIQEALFGPLNEGEWRGGIAEAHYYELYYAWMCMDESETFASSETSESSETS